MSGIHHVYGWQSTDMTGSNATDRPLGHWSKTIFRRDSQASGASHDIIPEPLNSRSFALIRGSTASFEII